MDIVINACYGGFGLSDEAHERYLQLKGIEYKKIDDRFGIYFVNNDDDYLNDRDIERNDPLLIQIINELGDKANGRFAKLKIITIPDDVEWEIAEYDGNEHVAEKHRTWY